MSCSHLRARNHSKGYLTCTSGLFFTISGFWIYLKFQPKIGIDQKEAEAKFQEIGEAYQFLMNPTPEKDGDPADENYSTENYVWNINGHQLNDEGFPIIADIAYAKGKSF